MAQNGLPDRPYLPPPATALSIIHEDSAIIVIDKPPGLLAVPGRGPEKSVCALSQAEARYGPLHVVHRLDMDTSGLMVFGRSREVGQHLSRLFEARRVKKTYHALIHGRPEAEGGTIRLPIGRDWSERPKWRVDHVTGKPSVTHWQMEARSIHKSFVCLMPETGRTHQLRVHLSAIGHAIIGDRLYGPKDKASRLFLHASALAFEHPDTGATLHLGSPAPFGNLVSSEK